MGPLVYEFLKINILFPYVLQYVFIMYQLIRMIIPWHKYSIKLPLNFIADRERCTSDNTM